MKDNSPIIVGYMPLSLVEMREVINTRIKEREREREKEERDKERER